MAAAIISRELSGCELLNEYVYDRAGVKAAWL